MNVSISDRAQTLSILEKERQELYRAAETLNSEQAKYIHDMQRQLALATSQMTIISNRHQNILNKLTALDDKVHNLLMGS